MVFFVSNSLTDTRTFADKKSKKGEKAKKPKDKNSSSPNVAATPPIADSADGDEKKKSVFGRSGKKKEKEEKGASDGGDGAHAGGVSFSLHFFLNFLYVLFVSAAGTLLVGLRDQNIEYPNNTRSLSHTCALTHTHAHSHIHTMTLSLLSLSQAASVSSAMRRRRRLCGWSANSSKRRGSTSLASAPSLMCT